MSKEIALGWIDDNEKRIIEISDKAWEYAEVGLLEYKTSELLANEIEKHGFQVEREVAGMPTAFVATWGSGKPVIGVMGELDALAGVSQKAVPYKDPVVEGGPGHGCGHNIHGTSGMAGAIAIKTAMEEKKFPGTVKFYGCPAEETLVGKVFSQVLRLPRRGDPGRQGLHGPGRPLRRRRRLPQPPPGLR
jgi:aminobenzoyl-glutamate utilization protein B